MENNINTFTVIKGKGNNKYNFLTKTITIISDVWFDDVRDFKNGFAAIHLKDKGWNFIDTNGIIISPIYFDKVDCFKNNISQVRKEKKSNKYGFKDHFNENFDIVRKFNIDESNVDKLAEYFIEEHARPFHYNFINNKGELISDIWFDDAYKFVGDVVLVKLNGKYNFINKCGKPISMEWFEEIKLPDTLQPNNIEIKKHDYFMDNEYVDIKINNNWVKINVSGDILYND